LTKSFSRLRDPGLDNVLDPTIRLDVDQLDQLPALPGVAMIDRSG
jgi:hypothetical protein